MTEQSPFLRYHQQRLSLNKNQARRSYEESPLQLGDNYLQNQLEEPWKSGKKENNLKVFGFSNSKQKKQQIPNPYLISQQSIEVNQDNLIQPQSEQLLIETKVEIDLEVNPRYEVNQLQQNINDENAQQQLQKLLEYQQYASNSSALHKEFCSDNISKFLGSQQEPKEKEIQREQLIQQSQQIELQTPIGTQLLDPNVVTKKNIQPLPFTDSVVVSTPQSETQRVSSYLQNKQEVKDNQQFIRTSSKIVISPQNSSKITDAKINILTVQDQPISRIIFQNKQAQGQTNKNTQMKKRSYENILKTTVYPINKQQKQINLPRKTTQKDIQQKGQKACIRNYLESYGSYEQQISKMINKFEKVSNLKQKQIVIKEELNKISQNHKKNQSVASAEEYYFTDPYSKTPLAQQQEKKKEAFAQSLSNFKHYSEQQVSGKKSVQQELRRDVLKMEKIINKFKEISQYVATESPKSHMHKHQMSEKNLRVSNVMKQPNNYSNELNYRSVEIPHNANNFNNLTDLLQGQYHNFNDSQEIIDSYDKQSIDFREKPKNNSSNYELKINRTARTDKKTTNDTQIPLSANDRYKAQDKDQNGCQSHYIQLIEEIKRLERKIDSIEKQKHQSLKKQILLQTHSIRKNTTRNLQSEEEDNSIIIQPRKNNILLEQSIEKNREQKRKSAAKILQNMYQLNKKQAQKRSLIFDQIELSKIPQSSSKQKQVSSALNNNKKMIKLGQSDFLIDLDTEKYKIPFPLNSLRLSKQSSQSAIIEFGQITFKTLISFAKTRFKAKRRDEIDNIEEGFKIKKYQDCIYFYLPNGLNFHLIYFFKGKLYFGEWKNGLKHGFGYYYHPSKYIYEGQFKFDKKDGRGTINYTNGDIYSGQWINSKREGEGVLINSMGDIFRGNFVKGKKHGIGEERLNNGDFYRGQFAVGRPQGEGIYWWADGSVYKGGFQGGLLHGKGIWRSKQNDYYEGQYRLNRKHGQGTYRWSNGLIFTGLFKDDEKIQSNSNIPILKSNTHEEKGKRKGKKRISVEQRNKHNH